MYIGIMRGVLEFVFVAVLVVSLTACGDGLFSSLDDKDQIEVETIVAGSFLESGAEVPLNLGYTNGQERSATAMTVSVLSSQGEVLQEVEYDSAVLAARLIPPLSLPDLPEGVYFLRIRAWRDGASLLDEERQFFVTPRSPEIRSLAVYPSRLTQRSESIAIAEITSDAGHRPYVRWSIAGRLVTEGYLEEGLDRAVFAGGRKPGVYAIAVDVFPWGPEEGVRVSGGTTIRQASDLVVRALDDESRTRNADNGSLLHYDFAGRLYPVVAHLGDEDPESSAEGTGHSRDQGIGSPGDDPDYSIVPDGAMQLDVVAGNLGYLLDDQRSMTVPVSAFPATKNSAIRMELRFLPVSDDPGVVFRMIADDGSVGPLSLRHGDEADTYLLQFGEEEALFPIPSGLSVMSIVVLTARGDGTVAALVRVNGSTKAQLEIPFRGGTTDAGENGKSDLEPSLLVEPGRIVLGGGNSASMHITSLVIRDASEEFAAVFEDTDET